METKELQALWALLDDITPLRTDCGQICGAACCEPSAAGDGMILLPGEKALLADYPETWFSRAYFAGFGEVDFFVCDGTCDRRSRPFACRVFPLAPRFTDKGISSRLDARGRPVCPLCRGPKGALRRDFIARAEEAFARIAKNQEGLAFLKAWAEAEKLHREPLW